MAQVDSENSTIAPEIAAIQFRKEVADQIERLIAFLDETDGDPDLEAYLTGYSDTGNDDREGDGADDEPSLGSFDTLFNQASAWRTDGKHSPDADLENDYCDDEEHEPSGIADLEGLMEQAPRLFRWCDIRVE